MIFKKFPFYKQYDGKDCGPTCLRIISKYYGKKIPVEFIRNLSETNREGSSLLGLLQAAEKIGFIANGIKTNFDTLRDDVIKPCIIHWNNTHFVVVYKIKKIRGEYYIYISDPSYGLIRYKKEDFLNHWINKYDPLENDLGVLLVLETTHKFYENDIQQNSKESFFSLYKYLFQHKKILVHVILGLLIGNLISLIFPLLTKSIVDTGIKNQDIDFVYLLLIGQFMLFIGNITADIIRNSLLLHLSAKINLSIISDFLIKLMRLPIRFFDTRITGDILQRINDHRRIEQFLTNSSLDTIFSLFNLLVYGIILFFYNYYLFIVFIFSSLFYVFWIMFFLNRRKELDYKRFNEVSKEQSKTIELINGMQEIKMHNAENHKRHGWEKIQVNLFKINLKSFSLEQWQSSGANFINNFKDIVMSGISAKLVIDGDMTLGMMLSIQYIIGQLDNPLTQLIEFLRTAQNAKISFERLKEIHDKKDEEYSSKIERNMTPGDIVISNLSFRYDGTVENIFDNLNVTIPYKKTTAIVGASGSGKTTLLKLLLKFYSPKLGQIDVGNQNLASVAPNIWRDQCGVVMQEGFIFNDSIENNIAVGEEFIDLQKLKHASLTANINNFIDTLALGYKTKIGNEGLTLSGGQKQRILIARAVYKSPEFVFLDEATSSLDANNETEIINKLNVFLTGRTAVIIAHRLSTVKNADKIIVIDKGKIVEEGNHFELINRKGRYFDLVKNQLELGN